MSGNFLKFFNSTFRLVHVLGFLGWVVDRKSNSTRSHFGHHYFQLLIIKEYFIKKLDISKLFKFEDFDLKIVLGTLEIFCATRSPNFRERNHTFTAPLGLPNFIEPIYGLINNTFPLSKFSFPKNLSKYYSTQFAISLKSNHFPLTATYIISLFRTSRLNFILQ